MGSKRSSKNPSNAHSSPPPSNPTVEIIPQNPKNSIPHTPSRSHKKQKLSAPIPSDISPHSTPLRWSDSDTLKLLKTIISLRAKGEFSLKPSNFTILLKEIKDWAPGQLSEKNMDSKLRHLRFKFSKSPKPGPESSEFDRSFHKLASKIWGPKGDEDVVKEEEEGEKDVVLENGEENAKDELIVDENSYKYLRLALEEYWTESKLNIDTLYAALPKVNPVQAKRLDEKFREVFLGMLKLKMDKNKVSNEIIHASLGC